MRRYLLLALALLFLGPGVSRGDDLDEGVWLIRIWYAGRSALEHFDTVQHTSPPLTVEMDPQTRLTIPPHLAEQTIVEIQAADLGPGFEEAVIVGLNARTVEGIRQGYALVYTRRNGAMELAAELPLREHFERIEKAWVNRFEPVLVLNGYSGNHFMDLFVYRFSGGQPELLFANGSATGAEFRYDVTTPIPTIWIGGDDWGNPKWSHTTGDPRWMVYTWDGDEFVYSEKLSAVKETSVEERMQNYTMVVMQRARAAGADVFAAPQLAEAPFP